MTYEQIFEKFLNHVVIFNSKDTFNCYKNHLDNVLKFFSGLDPQELDYNTLTRFIIFSQTKNISNATINKRLQILKESFKFNKIFNNDLKEFPKLKIIDKRFNALTLEETKKLILFLEKSTISRQNKAVFAVFLFCGVRLSELINIKAKNVNFLDNCILLEHTKSYRQRYVFFSEECKSKFLLPYFKTLKNINSNTLLFNFTKSGIGSLFARANQKLNFKKFSPHVLRHTYATLLVANNANISFIATTLGHSSLDMTKRYLHQDLINQKKIYDAYFNLTF